MSTGTGDGGLTLKNPGRFLQGISLAGLCLATGLAGAAGRVHAAKADFDYNGLARLSGDARFRHFVRTFWPTARARGISKKLYDHAFAGLVSDPLVIKRASHQPEFTTPVWVYLEKRVSDKRIARGREMLKAHGARLRAIEKRYGVDRHILLAIWGMESNYGSHKGKLGVIRSLATLAYTGRRRRFGRSQLIAALKILQRGDITKNQFTGSWAGAMGHTQFIPTTYNAYAVDWTGDGKRDIWNSMSDALASTAHYLAKSRWRPGRPWGWQVKLPRNFNYALSGRRGHRTVAKWRALGVLPATGGHFGVDDVDAYVIMPAGVKGPAFLVTRNFRAILAYNNAISYALSVGHLADRIRGAPPFTGTWPVANLPLRRKQRIEMQKRLSRYGFKTGGFSGRIGPRSRAAIRAYQIKSGLAPDGYAGLKLLEHLRGKR